MPHDSLPAFNVATYNIHGCIGTDRRFAPARVLEVLKRLDAEIVALQEVGWHARGHQGFDQFAYLAEHSGYAVHEGLTRDHSRAHFGNAILSRLPVREARRIDLTVQLRAPRCAVDADIEVGDELVRVINVHLGLDPWERRVQLRLLRQAIEARPERPMVLLGDFNEWRLDFRPFRKLAPHFPNCLAPRSFHARQPLLRYDRIYSSRELEFEEGFVKRSRLTRRASDHLPVQGRLRWAAAEAEDVAA
ncbi:MAG: endonuclease/exonuclease/phosphatase family protein [Kiloniellales bacterium]